MKYSRPSYGFTLIEMVLVIIILGVLAVSLSRFVELGTKIYVQSSNRDQLIASARFTITRMDREITHALPNSPRLLDGDTAGRCLEFRPIKAVANYLDVPVHPEPASDSVSVIPFDDSEYSAGLVAAVYTLESKDAYETSEKLKPVRSLLKSGNSWRVTLTSPHQFPEDSPTQRIYFTSQPVSFCLLGAEDKQLYRYEGYTSYNAVNLPDESSGTKVLMADFLSNESSFTVTEANQNRNGQVLINLLYALNDEQINFRHDIKVPNVP